MSANPPELKSRIIAEWAKGKFASEIGREQGITESKANGIIKYGADDETIREHFRNKALREVRRFMSPENLDREARVLRLWADGWTAADIAIRFGGGMTRNTPIGIVNRSRGAFAEEAKSEHAAASDRRYGKALPHQKRTLQEPSQRGAPKKRYRPSAAVSRVGLSMIANPTFVAWEKPVDLYQHMRTDKGFHDAIAALSR